MQIIAKALSICFSDEMRGTLRSQLSAYSRGLRKIDFHDLPVDQPMSAKSDSILFDGQVRTRKRIILLTAGCTIATCTMCPFPAESNSGVRAEDLARQFDNAFADDSIDDYEVITIFCNGNFFSDREVSAQARSHIFSRIRQSRALIVAVESLPQFLTERKVLLAKRELGSKKLAVFMGLQSADDFVREVAVNTTCTRKAFENAVHLLQANDFLAIAFLMVKPPFLTEEEAIQDTLASIQYLSRMGLAHSTLCPTRVAPQTVLEKMHSSGYYQPAWVWSIVEILRQNADSLGSLPMVNTTELKDEKNPGSTCAQGCRHCKESMIGALERFLFSRDRRILQNLRCDCYQEYERFKQQERQRWGHLSLAERIRRFLAVGRS